MIIRDARREDLSAIVALLADDALGATREAPAAGRGLVQLTSGKRRRDAIRCHESLGFSATHEGLKLSL